MDAFSFEGIHRHNAVVNFTDEDPIDPKAMWLNAELIRTLPVEELAAKMLPFACAAGLRADPAKMLRIAPLLQERVKTLRDVVTMADFFFVDELPPYDPAELIPQKGDQAIALTVLLQAREILAEAAFTMRAWKRLCAAGPSGSKLKQGRCSSPFASQCAGARTLRLCLRRWKCWGARPASNASNKRFRCCSRSQLSRQ